MQILWVTFLAAWGSLAFQNPLANAFPSFQVSPLPSPSPTPVLFFSLSRAQTKEGSLLLVFVSSQATAQATAQEKAKKIEGLDKLEGWSASFEGKKSCFFPVSRDGQETPVFMALLAVAHHHRPGLAAVAIYDPENQNTPRLTLPFVVLSGHYKTEKLKVNPAFTSPSPQELKLIESDQHEVAELYKKTTLQKRWTGPFILPISSPITSPYGTNRVFNHQLQSYHSGLDLRAPLNTPVQAPAAGTVVLAKPLFFTGNTVILDHGYGLFSVYAHLNELRVKVGEEVGLRSLLGLSGQTGRAKGPHLHWGLVVHGVKINPMDALTQLK